MPGMMMKAKTPMSYKKGGMVQKTVSKGFVREMEKAYPKGAVVTPAKQAAGKSMHKMPDGKMMPGAKHGATKPKK